MKPDNLNKGIFSGMMIACDIDGTVKPSGKPVCRRNMDAIEEFVSGGGIFTLATGRSIAATLPAVKEIGLKFPAIVNNGATAYDYATDEIIFSEDLDDSAYGIVEGLMERFPDCGIEVYSGKSMYILRRTEMTDMRLKRFDIGQMKCTYCTVEESGKPWQKALAVADEAAADEIEAYLAGIKTDRILFMRTSPHYCELVPAGATKAEGVLRLAAMYGISRNNLFTAGDHNNDIQLLKAGHVSFAPSDGLPAAKDAADITACSCEEGVVGDMVEYIKREKGRA